MISLRRSGADGVLALLAWTAHRLRRLLAAFWRDERSSGGGPQK